MSQQDIMRLCEQFRAEYEQLQRLLHVPTLEAEHYALARVCQQRMVSYHQQLEQLVGSDDAEKLLSVVRWWVIERERRQRSEERRVGKASTGEATSSALNEHSAE